MPLIHNANLTAAHETAMTSKGSHLAAWGTLKGTLNTDKRGAKAC